VSELLDELARTLAQPMPRRRAVRLLAGAVVAAAVPGVRAPSARAGRRVTSCKPGELLCDGCPSVNGLFYGGVCCPGPDAEKHWKCGCKPPPNGATLCIPIGCREIECGNACCSEATEYCADASRSLCCTKGSGLCVVLGTPGVGLGGGTAGTCCDNKTHYCAANNKRASCCPKPGQPCNGGCCGAPGECVRGECKCPKGTKSCGGHDCCKKEETCCPGKKRCCPKSKTCCGTECCNDENEICVGGKTCCRKGATVTLGSGKFCCPSGMLSVGTACCPPDKPSCCETTDPATGDTLPVLCNAGQVCVSGTCRPI
jgi:hypothetical protein